MQATRTIAKALTVAALIGGALSPAADAAVRGPFGKFLDQIGQSAIEHKHHPRAYRGYIDPTDHGFRAAHPIHLFLDFDLNELTPHEAHYGRNTRRLTKKLYHQIKSQLPGYVILVDTPYEADIALSADVASYKDGLTEIAAVRRRAPYRFVPASYYGECGPLKFARYDEVKVHAQAEYHLNVNYRLRGYGADSYSTYGGAEDGYVYGRNLQARTACGLAPTSVMPSKQVAGLFDHGTIQFKRQVRAGLKQEALAHIAADLCGALIKKMDFYYRDIAARHSRFKKGY